MATPVVPQDDFLTAVWSIQVMSYTNVAANTLWIYDLLLRFQQEATFLAQANKNVGKFLYIGARYMPLLVAIPGLITDEVSHMGNVDCQSVNGLASGRPCSVITDLDIVLTIIISSFHHNSSTLRRIHLRTQNLCYVGGEMPSTLCYIRNRRQQGIAVTVLIISIVPGQYVFVPDVSSCETLQVVKVQRLIGAILALLILDLVLVIFTVVKAAKNCGSTPIPLLTLLLTHHMFYYGIGFFSSIINILCVALFKYKYAVIFFNPQIMMHAFLSTRMHYQLWESEDTRRNYRQVHATGDWKVIYTSAHTTETMIEPPIGLSFDHPRLIEGVTNFLNDHFRFAITYKISNSDVNVPVRVAPRPASAAPICDGLPPRLHLVLSLIPLLIQMIVF
ncbi:hypothetical protein BD769DRAFT_1662331 [Suillus cothurnatus]|nr:hypothetical protein BD769DRAFT_1662331 [Suillus cothurnatus]